MYKPPYTLTNYMMQMAISISNKLGKISYFSSLEKMPILRRNNKIKSIHSSLMIEANSLSLDQVKDIINGKPVIGIQKDIIEVKNAYEAYEKINQFDAFKEKDLLKAQGLLTKQIENESGKYRNHAEGVKDGNKIIFIAPREDMVPKLMHDLFDWLANDNDTPILIKSCVFHYELVFIHPFSDANGRTARLWQNVILMRWNNIFEFVPIESQIIKYQNTKYIILTKQLKEQNFMKKTILE